MKMVKKVMMTMVMLFTLTVSSFGENNEVNNIESVEKYEFKVNQRRLANVLDMSNDQMEMSEYIIKEFENDLMFVYRIHSDAKTKVLSNAVKKHVKHMHYILNDKQYKNYLMLFNLTLKNRGFDIYELNRE